MSGPYISRFGDVISSALSLESPEDDLVKFHSNFSLISGQVTAIYTPDHPEHPYRDDYPNFTVYDVLVINADNSTSLLRGCRIAQPSFGGGINNFFEVTQTDPDFAKIVENKGDWTLMQGHFVIVGFVNGNMSDGVILGTLPHPSDVAKNHRPKKDDGVHTEGEIQGLNFKVDKDGAFTLTFQGPKEEDPKKEGKHKREEFKGEEKDQKSSLKDSSKQADFVGKDAPTTLKIDKNGNVTIENNAKQRVHVDREKKTIRIDNDQTYINMEQGDDGHAKVSIVANNIEIGHEDKDTTSAYNPKTGQKLQPMVMGDDLQYFMEQLIDEICKIVHPTGVGPSGTPVNKNEFQQLKQKLPQILSKKHRVEK
jgi:hypothetical protein